MGTRVRPGSTGPADPLIGRSEERHAIESLLDKVRSGRSGALVLRGEAGIGKTALLQHLVSAAPDFQVIHITAVESEMELPFAALHQICMPIRDHLHDIPEPQRNTLRAAFGEIAAVPPDRLLLGLAALSLISAASTSSPIACVVDDAQWLDTASAQALAFLARRLFAEPVCVVFATRTVARDLDGIPELHVTGLTDADARTLLRARIAVPLDVQVQDRVVSETGGNPLALVEWPKGLSMSELTAGFGLPDRMTVPSQTEELFRRRITDLPPETRQLLTVAAAESTGDAVTLWRAAERLGLTVEAATPALDAGLIEIGLRVQFRHPLARSASYRLASISERQAAHRVLAEVTEAVGDADRRAWHQALGSPGPDEAIAEELQRSAERARARGGIAATAALLSRSVALSEDPSRRTERTLNAAVAALEAGSFDLMENLLSSADRAILSPLDRARFDLVRARRASVGAELASSPARLMEVAQRLEPLDLELARATHLHALAAACTTGRYAREVDMSAVATAAAGCPPPEEPSVEGWLLSGLASATVDGPAAAAPELRLALADATEATAGLRMHLLGLQCAAASILWEEEDSYRLSELQVRTRRKIGALTVLPSGLNTLAEVMVLKGDLSAAASLVKEADAILEALGADLKSWTGPLLCATRGDDDAPERIAEMVRSAAGAGHGLALVLAKWAAVRYRNSLGEYDAALALGVEVMDDRWEWIAHRHYPELAEAAARSGDTARLESTVARLAETTIASGSNWALGMLARCRALLAIGDRADDLYRESIERLARTEVRPELARSNLLYGEWLRRERRKVDARERLRSAHDALTEMGMVRFAERARRELLATGESVRRPGASSMKALTPQEEHIARLAADGLTNPEIGERLFISARTVEWHLRKTYLKLGIGSRRDLRRTLVPDRIDTT